MEISSKPGKELHTKIGRIAAAIAFALMVCSVAAGPARAADHDRGGHDDRGHNDDRGRGRGGNGYDAPDYDYYYAPQPDYYYAPEPQYYYPSQPQPEYYPQRPSEGLNLFFGGR